MRMPDLDSDEIDVLPAGARATNLGLFCFDGEGRSWSYVTYSGQTGWIQDLYAIGFMP